MSSTRSPTAGDGIDTVLSSRNFSLADTVHAKGAVERLTLTGTALVGTGNNLPNIISGNSRANTLNGGGGNDTLRGLAGNDTYVVNSRADVVDERGGAGIDLCDRR